MHNFNSLLISLYLLVSFSIEMEIGNNKEDNALFSPEWRMESCFGSWTTYLYNVTCYDRCCLTSGKHLLICKNTKSKYGQGNAIFKINGKRYCDDFLGFKAMRTVYIPGN